MSDKKSLFRDRELPIITNDLKKESKPKSKTKRKNEFSKAIRSHLNTVMTDDYISQKDNRTNLRIYNPIHTCLSSFAHNEGVDGQELGTSIILEWFEENGHMDFLKEKLKKHYDIELNEQESR